jgi:hypothetical protein
VIDESDLQNEKQFDPRISTLFGIKIDLSDDPENASNSIRVKREFDSKTIHSSSHFAFRKTIEGGIQACRISETPSSETVTDWTEPRLTTTRRSENSVESEPPILGLDPRECNMKVKRAEIIVNIYRY